MSIRGDRRNTGLSNTGLSNTRLTSRAAFTLLEVVLALGLLAVGATALLSLFSYGALMSAGARTRVEAATALEIAVARVEDGLFPLLPDGGIGPPRAVSDQPLEGFPGMTWSVEAEPGPVERVAPGRIAPPALFKARVTVRWRTDGRGQVLSKTLLLPQTVTFGRRLRQRLTPDLADPGLLPEPSADDETADGETSGGANE